MNESLSALRRQVIRPLLDHEFQQIRSALKKQIKDTIKLSVYLEKVALDVLDNLALFETLDEEDEVRQEALGLILSRYRVNLVVDNEHLQGAPVIIEDNPLFRSLFGSIEYQSENEVLVTDFSRIRAGSLYKAHGGFLLLHLRDLLVDELVWEKLRRFLRSGMLQIEEPGTTFSAIAAVSLEPEAVAFVRQNEDAPGMILASSVLHSANGEGTMAPPMSATDPKWLACVQFTTDIFRAYRVQAIKAIGGYAMPEMVFIDGGGNIIYHQRGPIQMTDIQARLSEIVK